MTMVRRRRTIRLGLQTVQETETTAIFEDSRLYMRNGFGLGSILFRNLGIRKTATTRSMNESVSLIQQRLNDGSEQPCS